jgi:hypothetical protein
MRRARMVGLLVAALVSGCGETVATVGAVVVDSQGRPIRYAKVTIECPDGPLPEARTDDAGRFKAWHSPDIPPACTITVEKPGFATLRVPRIGVAYDPADDGELPKLVLQPK